MSLHVLYDRRVAMVLTDLLKKHGFVLRKELQSSNCRGEN